MRNASHRFFVDTNVLAYAYDVSEPERRQRALTVIELVHAAGNAAISSQVRSELCSALTRTRGIGMDHAIAEERVLAFAYTWPVYDVRPMDVIEAMRGVRTHKLNYFDALIWATARLKGIPFLLSEDGQDGRVIDGVRTINPLVEDFDLNLLS